MAGAMITKATFTNFRGFRDLTLDGLRRINLIVGQNGSGKSALMEGLSLAAGHTPQLALAVRNSRGLPPPTAPVPHLLTFFDDLFYRFDTGSPVALTLEGDRNGKTFSRTLTIGQEGTTQITLPLDTPPNERAPYTADIFTSPVFFEWSENSENAPPPFKTIPKITSNGLMLGVGPSFMPFFFFPARGFFDGATAAENFTRLDRENRGADFIETMRRIFPEIESITVGYEQTVGQILVKSHGLQRKISVSLLSDGMSRVVEILLGISRGAGGFVLIDEIENGIYFERYRDVLDAINEFSNKFGTQVFLTTHSDAILNAFYENIGEENEDFSIIRCSRMENGDTGASIINDIWAKRALESGIELRV